MIEETKLLRAAVEASIAAAIADPKGEHFHDPIVYARHADAEAKAFKAWEEYDLHICTRSLP